MAWHDALTERQRLFCEAFAANGGNAYAAVKEAGYKKCRQEGSRLLNNAGIIAALESLREDTTNKAIATREERQVFWSEVMRADEKDMRDRLKASELLGKSHADFIERKEVTGKDGAPLTLAEFYAVITTDA